MKKLAMAILLATAASSSAYADTYFKVGFEQLNQDFISKADINSFAYGSDSVSSEYDAYEGLVASDKGQSLALGIGTDLGDFVAVEFRYHMSLSNSSDKEESVFGINSGTPHSTPGAIYQGAFNMKEQQRADALILLYTPDFFGIRPYLTAGITTGKIKVNDVSFNNKGLVYGAGLEFKMSNNLSLSVEYLKYPKSDDRVTQKFGYNPDEQTDSSDNSETNSIATGEFEYGQTVVFDNQWNGDRANLSLIYRF